MNNSIASSSSSSSTTTIHDLPEPILVHILQFLYIPDAIETSLLSRKFQNLWHFIPSLHFNILDFYTRATRCDRSRQLFAEFVSQTLFLRPLSPLTKFKLTFEYTNYDRHKFHVQSWIRYAVNLSVTEIHLDFCNYKFYGFPDKDDDEDEEGHGLCSFDFHLYDIYKSNVEVLKLFSCCLILPPKTNQIKFVSLKSLVLNVLSCEVDDVCVLLERCVNLEILKLVNMEFISVGGLVIHSGVLKELGIHSCLNTASDWPLDLDIWCPSLEKISLVNVDVGKYVIKDTEQIVEAFFDFLPFFRKENYNKSWETMLGYFSNISSLNVWEKLLESNEVPAGCEQIASNVKHLELYCAYNENDLVGLAALLKLLPKLEILGLRNRGVCDANLHKDYKQASTVFNVPCLKKVILRKYQKTKSERHFVKLFKKSGVKIKLLHFNKFEEDKRYGGTIRLERRIKFART